MKINKKLSISFWKIFANAYRNLKKAYNIARKGLYKNTQLPIQVYINVKRDNDLSWLVKGTTEPFKVPVYLLPTLELIWANIEDSVLDILGVSQQMEKLARYKADRGEMWCLAEIAKLQGDMSQYNLWLHRIDELDIKIKSISQTITHVETDYIKLVASLDHNIDTWKMTTEMFFTSLKLEQEKHENNKGNGRSNTQR